MKKLYVFWFCSLFAVLSVRSATVTAGSCLHYNGANSYLDVGGASVLNVYPLTISAWVRTKSNTPEVRGIISNYRDASYNGYAIYLRNGRLRAWYFRNISNYIWDGNQGIDGGFVADGQWHHIRFVVNANGGFLSVDGGNLAFLPWTGSPGPSTSTQPLQIGRYDNYPTHFEGEIDEVTVWNQALKYPTDGYIRHRSMRGDEPGLIALWRFDEGMGNATRDSTASDLDATLEGEPEWITSTAPIRLAPVAGTAFVADGVDDQIVVPHDNRFNALPLTVIAWVKTDQALGAFPAIISKVRGNALDGWGLALNEGRLHTWYYSPSGGYDSGPIDFIANNEWTAVALVVTTNKARTYIWDGPSHFADWSGSPATNTEPIRMGTYPEGGGKFFRGQIDHVSIWNRELLSFEIDDYVQQLLTGTEPGLLAAYEFNELSGDIAIDRAGNFNGAAPGGLIRAPSLAAIGDGSRHLVVNIDCAQFDRRWAVDGSPTVGFLVGAQVNFWHFHDYGPRRPAVIIDAILNGTLHDEAFNEVSMAPSTPATHNFRLLCRPSSNFDPFARTNFVLQVPLVPAESLNTNLLYGATLILSHRENGGAAIVDQTAETDLVRLRMFDGRTSVFYSRTNGTNQAIWATSLNSANDRFITTGARPRASRDGRYMAFVRTEIVAPNQPHTTLWRRDLLTGHERAIFVPPVDPRFYPFGYDWDPATTDLLYDSRCDIWRQDLSGNVTRHSFPTSCSSDAPAVSPHGRIAFHQADANEFRSIYLTTPPNHDYRERIPATNFAWPSWSSSGHRLCAVDNYTIFFISQLNEYYITPGRNLSIIGTNLTVPTIHHPLTYSIAGAEDGFPYGAIWLPSGDALIGAGKLFGTNGIWLLALTDDLSALEGQPARLPITSGDDVEWVGSALFINPHPVIITRRTTNEVILYWRDNLVNYDLESAGALDPSSQWTTIASGITSAGGFFEYRLPNSALAQRQFFRLHRR